MTKTESIEYVPICSDLKMALLWRNLGIHSEVGFEVIEALNIVQHDLELIKVRLVLV